MFRHILAATAIATFAVPTAAHQDRWANIEIQTEEVAPGVAVLFGAGGKSGGSGG